MNRFLATLDNNPAQPVNGLATTGQVLWPSPFYVVTDTAYEGIVRSMLFGGYSTRLEQFAIAVQLLWVVEESVLVNTIEAVDKDISYTREQLTDQITGVTITDTATKALANLEFINGEELLSGSLRDTWQTAFSDFDKLAAIICHFGSKT
jgi:hypothetical protein